MKGFQEPNYTQTPNALFDILMKDMGEAELRVTLAVIRKTMGYHKDRDAISWTQIQQMTGLSRTSTQDGIEKAIEHGYIKIVGQGARGVSIYSLVVEAYQSSNTTSTGSEALPMTGSEAKPTKEKKEKKENKHAPKPLFDLVAKHSFGIADTSKLDKQSGARIGKIYSWLNKRSATEENVQAFYVWYGRETDHADAPRDDAKFAEWYVKFEEAAKRKVIRDDGYIPVAERTSVLDGVKLA